MEIVRAFDLGHALEFCPFGNPIAEERLSLVPEDERYSPSMRRRLTRSSREPTPLEVDARSAAPRTDRHAVRPPQRLSVDRSRAAGCSDGSSRTSPPSSPVDASPTPAGTARPSWSPRTATAHRRARRGSGWIRPCPRTHSVSMTSAARCTTSPCPKVHVRCWNRSSRSSPTRSSRSRRSTSASVKAARTAGATEPDSSSCSTAPSEGQGERPLELLPAGRRDRTRPVQPRLRLHRGRARQEPARVRVPELLGPRHGEHGGARARRHARTEEAVARAAPQRRDPLVLRDDRAGHGVVRRAQHRDVGRARSTTSGSSTARSTTSRAPATRAARS